MRTPSRRAAAWLAVLLALVLGVVGCQPPASGDPGSPPTRVAQPPADGGGGGGTGRGEVDDETGLRWVADGQLPPQARETLDLIDAGGPFPYPKDGARFANREGVLPRQASGYYREYTVVTPGSSDRGARRIVTGDHDRQFFYTADHYRSFVRVRR